MGHILLTAIILYAIFRAFDVDMLGVGRTAARITDRWTGRGVLLTLWAIVAVPWWLLWIALAFAADPGQWDKLALGFAAPLILLAACWGIGLGLRVVRHP